MEYRHYDKNVKVKVISAQRRGSDMGILTYYKTAPDEFCLSTLNAEVAGNGIGSGLVGEFVRCVGSGVQVSSRITNLETFELFKKYGIFEEARLHSQLPLIGPLEVFQKSPILKAFFRGGINTDILTVINFAGVPPEPYRTGALERIRLSGTAALYGLFSIEFLGRTIIQSSDLSRL
jgi:hypothetical protein